RGNMPKKRMGTVQDLRTAQKARLKSKPRTHGQELLELYILGKLKDRHEKEKEQAADSLRHIIKDMGDIAKDVEELLAEDKAVLEKVRQKQMSEARKEPQAPPKEVPGKPFKAVPFDY
ncbi:MAG: hypothetical protein QMC90_03415, partial [Dehalococcoidales bacterium]|nr:hypothetical protein [Dehalococcoidales bacterium]